jgi:hypothetical protein
LPDPLLLTVFSYILPGISFYFLRPGFRKEGATGDALNDEFGYKGKISGHLLLIIYLKCQATT